MKKSNLFYGFIALSFFLASWLFVSAGIALLFGSLFVLAFLAPTGE